jgi:protein SDA1
MKPIKENKQLSDTVLFLANISHCYPAELSQFPQQLIDILKKYSNVLNPEVRLACVRALLLIRNKNLIEPMHIFELAFLLFKCKDKLLRSTLYNHLLNDVKKMKTKLKAHKELQKIQQYVFSVIKDSNANVAKYGLVSKLGSPLSHLSRGSQKLVNLLLKALVG